MKNRINLCVAVCRRVNRVAFAVVGPDGVYDVHRIASRGDDGQRLLRLARQLAVAYDAVVVVAEPGLLPAAVDNHATTIATLALTTAKIRLCGNTCGTHGDLVRAVVARRPELGRLVQGARLDGPTASEHRWRTLPVLAIAIGLAFLQA